MGHPDPVLILTRPEPQSRSFLADLEERLGYVPAVVVSPIMRIEPVRELPDLDPFQTLIVTSGNAVFVLGDALKGRRVASVGARTAALARSSGAEAVCLGDNLDGLIQNLAKVTGPALHLRGRHSRGELVAAGRKAGLQIEECVVYDQLEQPLSREARVALENGHAILPLFSPRSARLVSAYDCHEETQVIAMSAAVAEAWPHPTLIQIAERPDRMAMLDLVAAAF
ncbi:MAG: uroporphyrinogen-III synthase [Paracoccaceae bacterium]|nr:uroporphyrinogen-III synthase [Paracoccaceae bacterium]